MSVGECVDGIGSLLGSEYWHLAVLTGIHGPKLRKWGREMAPASSLISGEGFRRSLPLQHRSEVSKQISLPYSLGIFQTAAFMPYLTGAVFVLSL